MEKSRRLQIPISEEKKNLLETRSAQLGFNSSTEAVRFLINNFLLGSINISINNLPTMTLDPYTEKEILESIEEAKNNQVIAVDPDDQNFYKKLESITSNKTKRVNSHR